MSDVDLHDTTAVAKMLGVSPGTVSRYRGRDRTGPPFPEPVQRFGGRPVWTRAQIETWAASRPGRGRRPGPSCAELLE